MADSRIPLSVILASIEKARGEIRRFNKDIDPSSPEYKNMFTRTMSGICGEWGYKLWAEANRLQPRENNLYTNDFFIGPQNLRVEVKTFKALSIEKNTPYIKHDVFTRILKHSSIVVFCKIGFNLVYDDYEHMERLYRGGINFDVLGWLYVSEIESIQPKYNDFLKRHYPIPVEIMRKKDELIEFFSKQKNDFNDRTKQYVFNSKNKIRRLRKSGSRKPRKYGRNNEYY